MSPSGDINDGEGVGLSVLQNVVYLVRLSGCNGGERVAGNFAGSRLWKTWYNYDVFEAGDRANVPSNCCNHLLNYLLSRLFHI